MSEVEITDTPQAAEPKSMDWPKIILAAVLGLVLLSAAAYAGYWYGTESSNLKTQSEKPQPKTQIQVTPTPTPTPAPVPSPETTPTTPTPIQDKTSNWRKISSARCGFEVRYPDGWSARETELLPGTDNPNYHYGCVDVLSPDYDFMEERKTGSAAPKEFYIKISRTRLGSEFKSVVINSLESYIKAQENIFEPPVSIDYSDTTFGSLAGKEYTSGGFQSLRNFVFREGDYIFKAYWPTGYDGGYGNRENIDQILSTFKFLD